MIAIYALIDPRGNHVRYVGKTDAPDSRLRKHLTESHNLGVASWVGELAELGMLPEMKVLEWVASADADSAERRWIGRHRSRKLLNVAGISDAPACRDWSGARRAPGWLRKKLKEKHAIGS